MKCAAAGHQYIVMDLPLLFEAGVIIAYMIIMITKLAYLIITIILAYVDTLSRLHDQVCHYFL